MSSGSKPHSMLVLAQRMMSGIQELSKESATITGKRIDECLYSINSVVSQGLPLKQQILSNLYFSLVHTLGTNDKRKHLDETQVERILEILLVLLRAGSLVYDFSFVNSDQMNVGMTALLIQLCLNLSKTSGSKNLVKQSLHVARELWGIFTRKLEVYPQICSTLFKFLNNEFANSTKFSHVKIIALNFLEETFQIIEKESGNCSSKDAVTTITTTDNSDMNGLRSLLASVNRKKGKEIDATKKINETSTEKKTAAKVQEFFKILSTRIELATKGASKKLMFSFAQFCVKVASMRIIDIDTLPSLLAIFFFVDDTFEETPSQQSSPAHLSNHQTSEGVDKNIPARLFSTMVATLASTYTQTQISSVIEKLKSEMLVNIKRLPRLVTELQEATYVKSLRSVSRVFAISRATSLDCFLPSEKETICESLRKAMSFSFNLKIRLMEDPSGILPLVKLDLYNPVTDAWLKDSADVLNKLKSHLIFQGLPIANYKSEILAEIDDVFSSMSESVLVYLFETNLDELLSSKYEDSLLAGSVASTLIAVLCSSHYILQQIMRVLASRQHSKQTVHLVSRYFQYLMLVDFYENFEVRSGDVEALSVIVVENSLLCVSILTKTHSIFLQLLSFLLKKHAVSNYAMRVATEHAIAVIAHGDELPMREFIEKFSTSIVQRCLLQIRSIETLHDKEAPFKIMNEIFVKFQGFFYMQNEVESVIATLNRCYDRFYLSSRSKQDNVFVKLYLEFFASFIEFWNQHTEVKQKTKQQLEEERNEYKKYSDDSGANGGQERKEEKNVLSDGGDTGRKFQLGNVMRHLLVRVKTLAVSRVKVLSVMTLQILRSSTRILYKLKQTREEDGVNFSTNDPDNVTIPDSLGPLLHEFEPSFELILRDSANAESTYLASAVQVVGIYLTLLDFSEANYAFLMVINVRKQLMPLFINILDKYAEDFRNSIRSKVARDIVAFIAKYRQTRTREKFLEGEETSDELIVNRLKDFKQACIRQLREQKGEQMSQVYVETLQNIYNTLDEFL